MLGNHDFVKGPLSLTVTNVLLIKLICQDVDDIRVVPNTLCRQDLASNNHAI